MNGKIVGDFARDVLIKLQDYAFVHLGVKKFDIELVVDFSQYRNRSYAKIDQGQYIISLCANEHLKAAKNGKPVFFHEYARIRKDPEIGEIEANWKKALACLIAHEYAHLVQFHYSRNKYLRDHLKKTRNMWEIDSNPHGMIWRWFYRELRRPINREVGFDFTVENCMTVVEKCVDGVLIKIIKLGRKVLKTFAEVGGFILELVNGEWVPTPFSDFNQAKLSISKV